MNNHIKVCRRRNKVDDATLPPESLADDESCRVDDTASDMAQFQNPVSDDESSVVG